MPILEKLDRSKPYGIIYGEVVDNIYFEQGGVGFDNVGVRVTPLSKAEIEAEKAEVAAAEKVLVAAKKREKAIKETTDKYIKDAEKPESTPKDIPTGFYNWSREELITWGRNKFNMAFSGNRNQIRAKIKDLL